MGSLGALETRFERKIGGSAEHVGLMERQKWGQLGEPVATAVEITRALNSVSSI